MSSNFADVALPLPSLGAFQYSIPDSMKEKLRVGARVYVFVRTRRLIGYVVGFSEEKAIEDVRDIDSVVDEAPILSAEFLELTRWMSDYYLCSWGQAIEAVLPAAFKKGKFLMKSRSRQATEGAEVVNPEALRLTPHQKNAFEQILQKIKAKEPATFLLHGITGSGKT